MMAPFLLDHNEKISPISGAWRQFDAGTSPACLPRPHLPADDEAEREQTTGSHAGAAGAIPLNRCGDFGDQFREIFLLLRLLP